MTGRSYFLRIISKHSSRRWSSSRASSALHSLLLQMPKEKPNVEILKASRRLKKEMNPKYPAGIINLQVLGTSPPSLYIFTDQMKYLFNCGEGTQRLAHEHKMKLAKLEHIFVTRNKWDMIGGLPGVTLTIQDIGIPQLTLHGPGGLGNLFEATKRFVVLKDLNIKIVNADADSFYDDHVIHIDYVPLLLNGDENLSDSPPPSDELPSEELDTTDYYGHSRKSTVQIDQGIEPVKKVSHSTVCYICQPKKKEGTLLIDKCIARGVPPGPLLGRLKAGEDITIPTTGEIVRADEVRSPDLPGPKFLIIDCPDVSYIPSLVSNPQLNDPETKLVVHFTNSEVMLNPDYVKWMESFRVAMPHLVMNDLCPQVGSEAIQRLQTKLNLVDSTIFPELGEKQIKATKPQELNGVNLIVAETLFKYNLRPIAKEDYQSVVTWKKEEYIAETSAIEEFKTELQRFNEEIATLPIPEGSELEYPKLLFLGTGSSIPNKTRNVSGMLLKMSESTSILLDCGEGTAGQLNRFFGSDDELRNIKCVYISHLHADHHLGLINIFQARFKAFKEKEFYPLYLIAPTQIKFWLNLYDQKFEKISHLFKLIPCTDFKPEFLTKQTNENILEDLLEDLGIAKIETDYVKHCPNAFGVGLTLKCGYKLTYSGDTMPCANLIKIGMNSDLLIHEATMEDELGEEAVIKMHSTVSQAIKQGQAMKAKFTLLTHFSQRYAKVPLIKSDNCDLAGAPPVGVAFDNMIVRLRKDLDKLGRMYSVLKALFVEDHEEMEMRSAKRRKKKELLSTMIKQN